MPLPPSDLADHLDEYVVDGFAAAAAAAADDDDAWALYQMDVDDPLYNTLLILLLPMPISMKTGSAVDGVGYGTGDSVQDPARP